MKKTLREPKLPQKRPRCLVKEEEIKRNPISTLELEKLKKFDKVIDGLLRDSDAFTVNPLITTSQKDSILNISSSSLSEHKDLLQEYLIDPQKNKKKFIDAKHTFDLIQNKEDPEQNSLLGNRLDTYNSFLPIPDSTAKMVKLLSSVSNLGSSGDRSQPLHASLELSRIEQRPVTFNSNIKNITSLVLKSDLPPEQSLSQEEKLKLVKLLSKYNSNWEKISKKFQGARDLESLKKTWRCLKFSMKKEVVEIQGKMKNFTWMNWLGLAKKKIEFSLSKKEKVVCVNLKPREERFDVLSIMADIENIGKGGIESATFLNYSGKSAFKIFSRFEKLQECCVNRLEIGYD